MTFSLVLDVIIGMVFTYFLLAAIASGVQEVVAGWLSWRGAYLSKGIDGIRNAIVADATVAAAQPLPAPAPAPAPVNNTAVIPKSTGHAAAGQPPGPPAQQQAASTPPPNQDASTPPSLSLTPIQQAMTNFEDSHIPFGWAQLPTGVWGWFVAVCGWVITALAVALGAPFWFGLLQQLTNLRNAGPSPKRADAKS